MNPEEQKPPETAEEQKAQLLSCAITNGGILTVRAPLFVPNGEFLAYGVLHKAMLMVDMFLAEKRAEADQNANRIIRPGVPPSNGRH